MFIPLKRFLQQSLVLRSFLVRLKYAQFFSFISACLMVSTSNIQKYFSFFPSILMFSWFGNFIPSILSLCLLFIISTAHFSISNYIPISWLYILIVSIRISSSFSFFCKYILILYIRIILFICIKVLLLLLSLQVLAQWEIRFYRSSNDSKSPLLSRTLFSIPADLSNFKVVQVSVLLGSPISLLYYYYCCYYYYY